MEHKLTLDSINGRHLTLYCSCQFDTIYEHDFPVDYQEMATVILQHLKPDTEEAVKSMLKNISLKDLFRELVRMKK